MAQPPQEIGDPIVCVEVKGKEITITFDRLSPAEREGVVKPLLTANKKYINDWYFAPGDDPRVLTCTAAGVPGNRGRNEFVTTDLQRRLSRLLRPALTTHREKQAKEPAAANKPAPAQSGKRHGRKRGRTLPA
jgi:hypothetical protein